MALASRLARGKVYYGWYIVALAFLAMLISAGLQAYAVSVFLKPMTEDLGWTRTMFVSVLAVGTLLSALFIPFVGPLLDKRGARGPIIVGAAVAGGGYIALSQVQTFWHFILIHGLIIPFGLIGMGYAVVNVAVSNWFIRKRGRALAIAALGMAGSSFVFVPLSTILISALGWRAAWAVLGAIVWGTIILPVAFFMRRRPEDMALSPDGELAEARLASTSLPTNSRGDAFLREVAWTRRRAMATRGFWLIVASFGLHMLGMGAVIRHLVPYFTDIGLSSATAASLMMAFAGSALLIKLPWGLLIERIAIKYCAVACFLLIATAALLLAFAQVHTWFSLPGVVLFGVGISGSDPVQEGVYADYFGRLSLGTVRTFAALFTQAASAVGVIFSALVFDFTGSYENAFVGVVAFYLLASLAILLSRHP